jgi:hypothetical protein
MLFIIGVGSVMAVKFANAGDCVFNAAAKLPSEELLCMACLIVESVTCKSSALEQDEPDLQGPDDKESPIDSAMKESVQLTCKRGTTLLPSAPSSPMEDDMRKNLLRLVLDEMSLNPNI